MASFLVLCIGCSGSRGGDGGSGGGGAGGGSAGNGGGGGGSTPSDDPLAEPAPISDLTDVSADLQAVLEGGALVGACDRYRAGDPKDLHARLLCGKSMFFYEAFGTGGLPTALVQFLAQSFPDDIGDGFARLGMIPDPSSKQHLPLGLATTTAKFGGNIDAVAFTCASCHFAQLPDGRYAVGAPNHRYAYGAQILDLVLMPTLALGSAQASAQDPAAVAVVQPLLDRLNADSSLKTSLLTTLLPLAGAQMPALTVDDEHHYGSWLPGTMDFLIAPLPIDDQVHTVSKISALWSIATPTETPDAQLGWTGGATSMTAFLRGFVVIGAGDRTTWTDDAMAPLADYVLSLRAPANPSPPAADAVARGRAAFAADGCTDCHGGPRGMGARLYDYSEIGTDDAMAMWAQKNIPAGAGFVVTGKLKSPRLVGTWAMSRFLHDGALPSLESLFCLAPRPAAPSDTAMGSQGHDMTCTLPDGDKQDLLAYLRAH